MSEETAEKIIRFADEHRDDYVRDLAALVEIPSVSAPGSAAPEPFGRECAAVLDLALSRAREIGMETKNAGNWYGLAWTGTGEHTTGIFTHLDVVEAEGSWQYPPFSLTVKDGWAVGRGTADDKCAAVIALWTARALMELGLLRHSRLMIYFGCSEEKGMTDLDRYLAENEEPDLSLVPDFIFPVAVGACGTVKFSVQREGGFRELRSLRGGAPSQRTPLEASVLYCGAQEDGMLRAAESAGTIRAEKKDGGILLTAEGAPASGFGKNDDRNAVTALAEFLAQCGVLTGTDRETADGLRKLCGDGTGENCGIAGKDEVLGESRLFPVMLKEDGGKITVTLRGQFPETKEEDETARRAQAWFSRLGFSGRMTAFANAWRADREDGRIGVLEEAWDRVNGAPAGRWGGGSTYAGKLKHAVNYGPKNAEKCPFVPAGRGDLHQPDEARSISNITDAVKTYIIACASLDEWYGAQDGVKIRG